MNTTTTPTIDQLKARWQRATINVQISHHLVQRGVMRQEEARRESLVYRHREQMWLAVYADWKRIDEQALTEGEQKRLDDRKVALLRATTGLLDACRRAGLPGQDIWD